MNLTPFSLFIQQALKYGFSLFGLPKTSQTVVYQAGDDGTYQKGYPKTGPRFTDNLDGTITDNATGLVWQKQDDNTQRTFTNAIAYAEALDLGGHSDWRLPNINELITIVNRAGFNPAIDTTKFSATKSLHYWSSTADANAPTFAWYVNFSYGGSFSSNKTTSYYVRCVRQ